MGKTSVSKAKLLNCIKQKYKKNVVQINDLSDDFINEKLL